MYFFLINRIYERSEQRLENKMTVRKGIPRLGKHRNESTSGQIVPKSEERANAGKLFVENGNRETEKHMKENPYRRLPPIERMPDGSLYRMTPAQRKQANALIRRKCCNCENGDCIAFDDGDAHVCLQMISFSVCCKWFH